MSETKTNEPVKQEGDFSLKGKSKKPKQLSNKTPEVVKVNIKEPLVNLEPDVTKVVIPKDELKQEANAIQEQSAESGVLRAEQPKVGLQEVGQEKSEPVEDVKENLPLQEITEEVKQVVQEAKEAVRDEKILGKPLPENIEKLVTFMEDTGGTVEDYVRLNADYSSVDDKTLLKEYYKKTKPYLESDDVSLLLEDYDYDEDLDEERDIRKKKIAFKEEVAKARNFLEETKSKYYDEIKLRPGVTQEQQKAVDFFNRYNEEQQTIKQRTESFQNRTKTYFNDDFKGFDINLGEKKFRYGLKDNSSVANQQSDISNFIKKFLNDKGEVSDLSGYHKALYVASNTDKVINHFYEQGRADAVRELTAKSKNISNEPRSTQSGDVFINGLRVKSVSGADSSKLRIKKR